YANGLFTSMVKNQGSGATPIGVTIGVAYWVDGAYRTWGAVVGPLAAGASVTIGTNGGSFTISDGTHTIMGWVDDVNRFTESNETNNSYTITRSVLVMDVAAATADSAPASGGSSGGTCGALGIDALLLLALTAAGSACTRR